MSNPIYSRMYGAKYFMMMYGPPIVRDGSAMLRIGDVVLNSHGVYVSKLKMRPKEWKHNSELNTKHCINNLLSYIYWDKKTHQLEFRWTERIHLGVCNQFVEEKSEIFWENTSRSKTNTALQHIQEWFSKKKWFLTSVLWNQPSTRIVCKCWHGS